MTEFVVDFEALFSTTQVQVVQAVDYAGLKETLKWVVEQLQSRPADSPSNANVEKQLANLASEWSGPRNTGTGTSAPPSIVPSCPVH
jgi:hypothetical protein